MNFLNGIWSLLYKINVWSLLIYLISPISRILELIQLGMLLQHCKSQPISEFSKKKDELNIKFMAPLTAIENLGPKIEQTEHDGI